MEPLNILHHLPISGRNWGGVQVQFASFVSATARDPRLRNFLSLDKRALPPNYADLCAQLAAEPFDNRAWYGLPLPTMLRVPHESGQARRWRIDAVVNTNFFGNMRAAKVARKSGAAAAYWERGAAWFERRKPLPPGFASDHAMVIANSDASRQMLRQLWGFGGPIEICTPCVWNADLARHARSRSLAQDRPLRLGFAARLRGFKGGVLAVHALKELRQRGHDVEIWIAGEGEDRGAMTAAAEKLDLSARVRFLGHVEDMERFYAGIDILLHPALREPYGNVCAEAALAGVPVVATLVDGLPEVVEHGATGLCVTPDLPLNDFASFGGDRSDLYPVVYRPELGAISEPALPSPDALADAVATIAATPESYRAFSKTAAALAPERFSPSVHIDRFVDLMRQAVERS